MTIRTGPPGLISRLRNFWAQKQNTNAQRNTVVSKLASKFQGFGGINAIATTGSLGILAYDFFGLFKNITSMLYAQDLVHAYEKDKTHKLTKSNLDCLKGLFTLKSIVDVVGFITEVAVFFGFGPKTGALLTAGIFAFTEFIKNKILDENKKDPAIIMEAQLNSPDDNQQTLPPPAPSNPTPPSDTNTGTSNTSQGDDDTNKKAATAGQNNTGTGNTSQGDDDANKKAATAGQNNTGTGNNPGMPYGNNGFVPYTNGAGLTGAGNNTAPNYQPQPIYINLSPSYGPITRNG